MPRSPRITIVSFSTRTLSNGFIPWARYSLEGPRRNRQVDEIKLRDTVSRIKDDKTHAQTKSRSGLAPLQNLKKTVTSGPGAYQARKNALYASARRSAKDLVHSGVTMLQDMQTKLDELKSQQTTFQKNCDDFQGPRTALQQVVAEFGKVYAPMLDELGEQRSETLEDASTMLKHNAPRRQSVLKEFSKNARQQLEQVKQQEKDAEDASNLIKHYKNLLRG